MGSQSCLRGSRLKKRFLKSIVILNVVAMLMLATAIPAFAQGPGRGLNTAVGNIINQVGIDKEEWVARKELTDGRPIMCLYIDREPEQVKEMRHKVHRALGKVDPHYREASYTLGYPLMRLISTRAGAEGLPKGSDSKQVAEAVALD